MTAPANGTRFGTRVVIGRRGGDGQRLLFRVRCDCGHVYETSHRNLRRTGHCIRCNHGLRGRRWTLANGNQRDA